MRLDAERLNLTPVVTIGQQVAEITGPESVSRRSASALATSAT
jgi:hypothetical protein